MECLDVYKRQRVHRRMVEINNSTQKTIASLTAVNLPAGVGIEIKQI